MDPITEEQGDGVAGNGPAAGAVIEVPAEVPAEVPDGSGPGFLAGGGELGALMRGHDWAATPLGPPDGWPQSLKTAVRIMLTSRQPIWIGWGRELTYLYNDPYKSIIGGKHPRALGQPTSAVWSEIWADIDPLLTTAMTGVEGTYVEDQLLIMERNGYPEETYYTFSYSPIPDDDGSPGGIICANTDVTERIIGERQLALLRELAARTSRAQTWQEVCGRSAEALATDPKDVAFALIYLAEPGSAEFALAAATGIAAGHPAAPEMLAAEALAADAPARPPVWPLVDPAGGPVHIPDLRALAAGPLPDSVWNRPATQAVVLPLPASGETGRSGLLVVGLNPYRLFDDGYRRFLGLVAGQVAAAIANAESYEAERRRAEALAEIDRAKTAFFSNASHEFRTPLTLMLGPLEEMLHGPAPQAGRSVTVSRDELEMVQRNGQRLLRLVNALLDFSRIEAGRMRASFVPVDLAAFTADLASSFRSAMDKAGLAYRIDCPALPEPVWIDRDLWEKIVLNLISNAFKYTLRGEVAVTLEAVRGAAVLKVRDTGTGIPEAELDRVFDRFHRIDGQVGRTHEGTGIGLALVKDLTAVHGGAVRVESRVGEGTVFTVSLPFGRAHLAAADTDGGTAQAPTATRAEIFVSEAMRWLPEAAAAAPAGLPAAAAADTAAVAAASDRSQGETIVLADDNADMRGYVERLLAGAGYRVVAVGDGRSAVAAVRAVRPDLVLSDVMMPHLDGFGVIDALRRDPDTRDLPIILLSARAGEESAIDGLQAGADDYVAKPFSARELIARVEGTLRLARLRRETSAMLRAANEELERRVAERTRELNQVWRNSRDLLAVVGTDGLYRAVNPAWTEILGYRPEEMVGCSFRHFVWPEDLEWTQGGHEDAVTRNLTNFENRFRHRDGTPRWISWHSSVEGDLVYAYGRHVTAEKEQADALRQTEEQLRRAQKMEAVGQLTGGVAHDFNNLLQVIGGNLQLLANEVGGNPRAADRVRNALSGVSRGAKLASSLLAFARRQPLEPRVVNLGRLIRGLDDMLRRALGEEIRIEVISGGGLWNTVVDPTQVENAVLNLAINARDAMNGHGQLTIEAGNAELDEAYAARHSDVQAGQYVMLAVTDTGSGMPPEVQERAFDPFFTTKPEGHGTGLGLSMVYGFVKQSGGHIKIYSEMGHGTTIRLYLPRTQDAEDLPVAVDSAPVGGGSETVLVVEDDEEVRQTVVALLADLDYRVLQARDAQSALAILESGVPIDLLFTDVVMPGPLRSPELARKAQERLPNLAVLFTSGYTQNAIVHGGRLDPGVELLSKPYTREVLARKIRQVLNGRKPERAEPAVSARAAPADASGKASIGSLTVLLVEDDALIRMSVAEILADLGHRALEAEGVEDALRIVGAGEGFDLLFTDLTLPDGRGEELAAVLSRRMPGLPVVFASGRMALNDAEIAAFGGKAVHLQKPYDLPALERAILAATAPARAGGAVTGR
ncbi:response regulator [Azospirillum sp. HJ39]|uniref:response regulator n=1 Tax=Azospirillum sp. HJ39 TaxID=3159496 RepID=UPI003558FC0B